MSNLTLAQRIEDVLTTLYDYEYIDIEKFYNDNNNQEVLSVIDRIVYTEDTQENDAEHLAELYNNIADFIHFETNYNSCIGDF